MSKDCVFCNIANGGLPASVIFDDEKVMAIMDIEPINPGHVLVFPKRHFSNISELNEGTDGYIFQISIKIAKAIQNSDIRCEGLNIILSDASIAGQDVFHTHINIIPRFFEDELRIEAKYGLKPTRTDLDIIAQKIRKMLKLDTPSIDRHNNKI